MGADNPGTERRGPGWVPFMGLGAIAIIVAAVGLAIAAARAPRSTLHSPAPSVPSAEITPTATQPPAGGPITGLGFSVVEDPATHRIVLFGGVGSSGKTWLWDGRQWMSTSPASSPPNRSAAAAAYDPATHMVMLFGGQGGLPNAQLFNDTWAWNGNSWLQVNAGVKGPPAGGGAQMAWDQTRSEMVLVTYAGTLTSAETWTWNRDHWVQQVRGNLTAIVFGAAMAYDPVSHAVLLISPAISGNAHSVSFAWNGSIWRVVATGGPKIDGVAVESQVNALVACGSATYSATFAVHARCWQWTGTNWHLQPGAATSPAVASATVQAEIYDIDRARLLLFGWSDPDVRDTPQPVRVWAGNGPAWILLA